MYGLNDMPGASGNGKAMRKSPRLQVSIIDIEY